jgi:ferredoxin-NADP reductase
MFYISGPEPMVKALGDMVAALGVQREHIRLDDFPGYTAQ